MEIIKSIIETIICGGPVMIPIIVVSLIVWTLIIKKLYELNKIKSDIFTPVERIVRALSDRKESKATGILSKIVEVLLGNKVKTKESLAKSAQGIFLEEYQKLMQHIPTIGTLTSIAPLLGLLGTVTGMVSIFSSITLYGTGDPQSLAKGISEALITTQSGLIVAIPALFFYNHLLKKVDDIMNGLERSVTKLINFLAKDGGSSE